MIRRYPLAILIFFIFIAFFLPLPFTPLFDLDEGAFSEATREMLVGKDYITTYLNGFLRFDKPILIYWLQLISVKSFGLNEFALRLPSAIAGTFWALAIYHFVKKMFDNQTAFFATLLMIASIQINMITKAAIADSLLNLFIVLSMFSLYYYYQQRSMKFLYGTFIFIALGVLTKGPVAIMIPFVVSLLFFSIKGEFQSWLKMIFNPKGIALFLIVALPWYIAEYQAQGQAFIDGFFFKHNLSRFSSAMENHHGGYFYFVPVLLVGMMPFTYFVIKALKEVRHYFRDDLKLYLILWFTFVFVFFSFSGTKLPHYVIYGYTPLFILGALYISEKITKAWLISPLLFLLTFLLFLPEIATMIKANIHDELALLLIENASETFDFTYRLFIITVIALLLFVTAINVKQETIITTIAFAMIVTLNYVIIPTYGKLMQQPIKEAGVLAKERGYQNIIMYGINMPSFNVYYEGYVLKKQPQAGEIVFTKIPKLKDFKNYETLYRKNGFTLIKVGKE